MLRCDRTVSLASRALLRCTSHRVLSGRFVARRGVGEAMTVVIGERVESNTSDSVVVVLTRKSRPVTPLQAA